MCEGKAKTDAQSHEGLPENREPEKIENADKDVEIQAERVPYPKSVFFIVSNEFCERFSFYGMRTILSIYLRNQLKFTDTTSTIIYHLFIMICYFFPLFGAIVADSWLGKYKTILYLSLVYALGNLVVSVTAIPNTLPQIAFTMIGLVLIALGTGGIKPCVAAFVFYFIINLGSFLSTLLTPILREVHCFGQDSCFSLAFGVPAILMILSIVIFLGGKKWYKVKKPEGNVVVKVAACMWHAVKRKSKQQYDHWLDKAEDKYEKGFIEDIKATLKVLVLYIPLPIFWALFDQQGSRWTFQATRMNGDVGSIKIQPDQVQFFNPLLILVFIPLFDNVIYPLFAKCNLLKRPLQRLTVGGLLAAAAFGISALVETALEPTYAILPQPGEGQIRLYNALPHDIKIDIPEMKKFDLKSLEMWENLHVPVSNEISFDMTFVDENRENKTKITVYENEATSYTFLSDRLLIIRNEDNDKSMNGNPKVMAIYSGVKDSETKKISLVDSAGGKTFSLGEVDKTNPHTEFIKVPDSSDRYILLVDEKKVLENIELKQGGVYNFLITETGTGTKAKILTVTEPNSVSMLLIIPQYVVITAGEVMFSVTGLEFSFTQAPSSMKALLQAAWLLTVALGNLIVVIIAKATLLKQTYEFLLFAALMAFVMFVFALIAMRYTYVENTPNDEQPPEKEDEKQRS